MVKFVPAANRRTDLNGSNPYALDSILVFMYDFTLKRYESRPQKTIAFRYSNFPVLAGSQGRLKLDSVKILDKAGSIVQVYKFTYNSTALPPYPSYSRDLWGYYNGKLDDPAIPNKTLIPRTKITVEPNSSSGTFPYDRYIGSSDSTSRDPDTVKMQAGVLTRIDYPTGGHTNFTYETNRYIDDSLKTHFTGGLRIAAIASYSSPTAATPVLKSYKYNDAVANFITGGGGLINYGFFMNSMQVRYVDGGVYNEAKRLRTYYSESSNTLTPTDGNPVAYKKVTEYIGDPTSNIGKSVYTYRHMGDQFAGSTSFTGTPITIDYFYARGQLAGKTDYIRKTDGSYQIAKDEIHNYSAFRDSTYDNVGLIAGQGAQSESSNGYPMLYLNSIHQDDRYSYLWTGYWIISGDSYPTSTITKIYDQIDPTKFQTSTVEYKYDNFKHKQVTRTRQTDSRGSTKVTLNKYPADYLIGAASSTNNIVLDSMLRNNMQAELVEKWDSVKNAATGITAVIGGQLNLYENDAHSVLPHQIKTLKVGSPLTDFTPAYVSSGDIVSDSRYQPVINFDLYDTNNNLLQYTAKNSAPISVIWDYNDANAIAKVINAPANSNYRNFSYTSFEANGKDKWEYNGTKITDVNAPTGKQVYQLSSGLVTLQLADLAKPHIVSYWSNGGAASVTINSVSYPGVGLKTSRGYTLYEHAIPVFPSPPTLTVSGSVNIDELKFYPADAQMMTYTYGTDGISEMTDAKDQILSYQYDEAQRLKNVKDWNGNIVKNYDYHNYDMTVGNDAIAATTFTRDNCPPNSAPGSTTYAVPVNTHYSSTKASANKLAKYDLQINGQRKANDPANCGCPILYVTFTATNSTGYVGYQANFTGPYTTYMSINATGTTTQQIPAGTYTVQVSTVGTQVKTFSLGGTTINGHTATFNNVVIQPGSSSLTLSIY
jgi:hypothetical protein